MRLRNLLVDFLQDSIFQQNFLKIALNLMALIHLRALTTSWMVTILKLFHLIPPFRDVTLTWWSWRSWLFLSDFCKWPKRSRSRVCSDHRRLQLHPNDLLLNSGTRVNAFLQLTITKLFHFKNEIVIIIYLERHTCCKSWSNVLADTNNRSGVGEGLAVIENGLLTVIQFVLLLYKSSVQRISTSFFTFLTTILERK